MKLFLLYISYSQLILIKPNLLHSTGDEIHIFGVNGYFNPRVPSTQTRQLTSEANGGKILK